jgi:magnesium and cobalt exporter, CNNM family
MSVTLIIVISSIILLLVVVSAFFSSAETAFTAASRSKFHTLAKEGNHRAQLVNRLRGQSERLIGSILFGNTLVNIFSSALITYLFTTIFGDVGVVYATIIMTFLLLVFGEILPKTYALNNSDKVAIVYAPFVFFIVKIFKPFVKFIKFLTFNLLKLFGAHISSTIGEALSDEELRGAIDLHHDTEIDPIGKRAMLRSILDLKEVDVEEVMIHRKNVHMMDVNLPLKTMTEIIISSQYSRIPLWEHEPENIVGVLHEKTLLRAIKLGENEDVDIKKLMVNPWFIPETTSLFDQLQVFREKREHFAVVVDEYGAFMGVVTLEDILEEIVGDITDEYDIAVTSVRAQPDGSYIMNGAITIRDINRQFEWDLPDEEASTLAGLLLHEAQTIPEVGQILEFYGFRFKILRRQRNQITSIQVFPKQ